MKDRHSEPADVDVPCLHQAIRYILLGNAESLQATHLVKDIVVLNLNFRFSAIFGRLVAQRTGILVKSSFVEVVEPIRDLVVVAREQDQNGDGRDGKEQNARARN